MLTSHRVRVQEKRLFKRLVVTGGVLFATFLFLLFVGLPLFARFIVAITSLRPNSASPSISPATSFLFPPTIETPYEVTNSAKLTLTGLSEKEATIKILINKKDQVKVPVDKEGKFTVKNILLTEGPNTIIATTIKGDKESSSSPAIVITYKKNPPKLEVTSPKEGTTFSSDQKEMTLTGETEPGSRVTINDRFVIVDTQGKFTYTTQITNGENIFKVVAEDEAGNKTTLERKVTYNQ